MDLRHEFRWTLFHPGDKCTDLGMLGERLPGVIATGEFFFWNCLMNFLMADSMDQKLFFAALRAWDKMMLINAKPCNERPAAQRAWLWAIGRRWRRPQLQPQQASLFGVGAHQPAKHHHMPV